MSDLLPQWLQPSALQKFSRPQDGAHSERNPRSGVQQRQSEVEPPATPSQPPPSVQVLNAPLPLSELRGDPTKLPSHYVALPGTALCLGFLAGVYTSANKASLVFMAENAHRRPTTVQGWYFYNKTKNYRVMLAAGKGGFATGLRLSLWVSAFVALDEACCAARTGFGSYVRQLRAERQAQRAARRRGAGAGAGMGAGAAARGAEQEEDSLQDVALDALHASIESIRGLASGGQTSPDTSLPGADGGMGLFDVPARTYRTEEDLRQLESSKRAQAWPQDEKTYSTAADVRAWEAAQAQGRATGQGQLIQQQQPPWWSEAAWYQRQAAGGMWIDSMLAGSVTAFAAVALYRIPPPTSTRAVGLGAITGAAFGVLREAQAWLREARAAEAGGASGSTSES